MKENAVICLICVSEKWVIEVKEMVNSWGKSGFGVTIIDATFRFRALKSKCLLVCSGYIKWESISL